MTLLLFIDALNYNHNHNNTNNINRAIQGNSGSIARL